MFDMELVLNIEKELSSLLGREIKLKTENSIGMLDTEIIFKDINFYLQEINKVEEIG